MSLFTEAGLAAIEEAIAGGYLEVEYDNKRIRYRTLDELLRVRNLIRQKLGKASAAGGRVVMKYKRDDISTIEGGE